MAAQHIVEITDLTVRHNGVLALDSVSLAIDTGEFTAIVGPNGAGKTTLIKAILGLIEPDAGEVKVFGVSAGSLGRQRARIGYVPQTLAVDLGFPVTVFETVLMGTYGTLGVARRPGSAQRQATLAALERAGIAHLTDRPIARLSSGQRQRAFIARAMVNRPELLLLDEPTTGVDIEMTGSLYAVLRDLKAESVTIMLVSHDIGVVASYVDTLACLNTSLVAHCRPDDAVCSEAMAKMYGCDAAFFHHGRAPHIVVEDH